MENVFLLLDTVIGRQVAFETEYVFGESINSVILMSENNYMDDCNYFFKGKKIKIFNSLQECVEHCDTIIVSDNYIHKINKAFSKDIIILDLKNIDAENSRPTIPQLDYQYKPVIAILSLGEYNDQYITEILINKILTEKGAKVAQYYSPLTRRIIKSYAGINHSSTPLLKSHIEDYDIIVLSINGINSYKDLISIMCHISPDLIFLCVNKSYRQEEELKRHLYFCKDNIAAIIKSPYISYEIIKGKTYPVYCGHKKTNSHYGSFEKDLYNMLKEQILKHIYLPEDIVLL